MNNMLKYTKMLLLFVLVLGLTSCDSEVLLVHMATRIICFSDGIGLVGLTI